MGEANKKDVEDVGDTVVAKSTQLNADDLVGGPITVTITDVKRSVEDQPIAISIGDKWRPFMPCKTVRRVLVSAWGKDASRWIGKSLRLVRDASVLFGGKAVGGIRIEAMSDIPKRIEMYLSESRGKKKLVTIDVLVSESIDKVQRYKNRIAELKTAAELKVAHSKFDAIRADLTTEQQEQIELSFTERLKAVTA